MKWAELLKKSTEYARKSVEELASALRNSGPSPSYEPAYSKYRNRQNQLPPQKKVNFSHESNMNLWRQYRHYHSHKSHWNRKSHFHRRGYRYGRCRGRLWSKFVLKLLKVIAHKRPILNFCNNISLNCRPSIGSGSLQWKPNRALSALVTAFHPQMNTDLSNKGRGFTFMPQIRKQYILNSPFQMLKTTCMTGMRSTPSLTSMIQHKLSSLPTYKSQELENRRNAEFSALCTAFVRTVAAPSNSFDAESSKTTLSSGLSSPQLGESDYLSDLNIDTVLSSALDFDINPRLTLPLVSELTEETVSSIGDEFEMQRTKLQLILSEFKRVSELGELPVSVEQNGLVLRVHFPNCDPERLKTLCDEKDIVWGRIVEIINPNNHFNETDLESIRSSSSSSAPSTTSSISSGCQSISGNSSDQLWAQILEGVPELTESISSSKSSGSGSPSLSTFSIV